jgi:hypothetical protein
MTNTPASATYPFPRPVRTFADPVTGVTLHQLTDGDEPAGHLYFTRCSWTADGRYLLYVQQRDGSINYYAAGADGTARQVTHYPPSEETAPYTQHMHRLFRTPEVERMMLRLPAMHPTRPLIAFAWRNEVHLLDIETGDDDVLHRFGSEDSQQPFTGLHTVFTADGRDLLLVTSREGTADERLDPSDQPWDFSLRDESRIISRIWRYDFEQRRMDGVIFQSNGEQSHLLTCPWDAETMFWVNYLHKCCYLMRRDGTVLRRFFADDPHIHPGHYNWDAANRRMTILLSDPQDEWHTTLASLDTETGVVRRFQSGTQRKGQYHQNASPDGRWFVLDGAGVGKIGGQNGLWLVDQHTDQRFPLCQLNCSWSSPPDPQGRAVKSEFLHPNPSWSPDGRWIVVGSDFGSGVAQVYLVDLHTWSPT